MMTVIFSTTTLTGSNQYDLSNMLRTGRQLVLSADGGTLVLFQEGERIDSFPLADQHVELRASRSCRS